MNTTRPTLVAASLAVTLVACGPDVSRLQGAHLDVSFGLAPAGLNLDVKGHTKETCDDFRYDVSLANVAIQHVSRGLWREDGAFAQSPACLTTTYRTPSATAEALVSAIESGEPVRFSDGTTTVSASPPFRCMRVTLSAPSRPVTTGQPFELEYAPADAVPPLTLKVASPGCSPWVPSTNACSTGAAIALGTKVRDGVVQYRLQPRTSPGTFEVYGESNEHAFVTDCPGFDTCDWNCRAPSSGSFSLVVQ
jgi:hypothetical protein